MYTQPLHKVKIFETKDNHFQIEINGQNLGIKFKSEDNADLFLHRLGLSLDLFIKAWPK